MYDDMSDGIPDGSAKSGVGFQNLQTKLEYVGEFLKKIRYFYLFFVVTCGGCFSMTKELLTSASRRRLRPSESSGRMFMLTSWLQNREHKPSTRNHWMVETICELRQEVHAQLL
jgi:hypothetical protein